MNDDLKPEPLFGYSLGSDHLSIIIFIILMTHYFAIGNIALRETS